MISSSLSHPDTTVFCVVPQGYYPEGNTVFKYSFWDLARNAFLFPFGSLKSDSIKPDSVQVSSVTLCFYRCGFNCILWFKFKE